MLAVHLAPKDASLWKLLVTWSLELGNGGQAIHCFDRAIRADPEDMSLRYHCASLFVEIGEHLKAAESYAKIWQLRPKNFEALKTAAMLYLKCSQHEHIVSNLEDYWKKNPKDACLNVVQLLASMHMLGNAHEKALQHIEYAQQNYCGGKDLPVEMLFKQEYSCSSWKHGKSRALHEHEDNISVLSPPSDSESRIVKAFKRYLGISSCCFFISVLLYLEIGRCYSFLSSRTQTINYFYKALHEHEDNIDARLELVSVLLEADKDDEAISVLSPPSDQYQELVKPLMEKKLCYIYKSKGRLLMPKANRAKRSLQKQEERQAAALAAGVAWQSDESDDNSPVYREPPLPNLLKDEELLMLIIDK
ncbi:hypothetical protein L1887_04619 [Cichorium endivia]|nr:hypothetical protein L1887_04619 [Cichorium endivia]